MQVFDLYKNKRGIFYYLIEKLEFENAYLGDFFFDVEAVDLSFIAKHGSQEVNSFVKRVVENEDTITEQDLQLIASLVYELHRQKWNGLIQVIQEELPIHSHNLTTTETISDDGSNTNTLNQNQNGTKEQGFAGFDSNEYKDEFKETNNKTGNTTSEGTDKNLRERSTKVVGESGNAIQNRKELTEYITNNLFINNMFKDVAETITLLIY